MTTNFSFPPDGASRPVRFSSGLLILAALLASAGCAEARFAREDQSAQRQISIASDEGGTSEDLEAANRSLTFARESEARATADLTGGREDLKTARERLTVGRSVLREKRASTSGIDARVAAGEADVARTTARQAALKTKGLTEGEVVAASGLEASQAQQALDSAKAARETNKLEVPLAELECKAADAAIKAASVRISLAEQRLEVARSLYARSEQQARTVEMEALAGKRDAIDNRMKKD